MRRTVRDELTAASSDDLLTTGEVALLLSCSRQHVVDLCNLGELPYETVGTHRRIRRRDAEAMRSRTLRSSRDQQRSQWLNTAIAGKLVRDPQRVLEHARSNVSRRLNDGARGQSAHWLDEWRHVLDGPTERVLEALTSMTPWAREMRQNSPFSGILSDDERTEILTAFREHERSQRRGKPRTASPMGRTQEAAPLEPR